MFMYSLMVVAIGFGVPAAAMYFTVRYGFNEIVTGVISFIAVVAASLAAVVGAGTGIFEARLEGGVRLEREKLNLFRAQQRAMLEELDEIVKLLDEIRNVLRSAQEG